MGRTLLEESLAHSAGIDESKSAQCEIVRSPAEAAMLCREQRIAVWTVYAVFQHKSPH